MNRTRKIKYFLAMTRRRATLQVRYCMHDVWDDTRDTLPVKLVKIANLAVRSILDSKLQQQACALTYRTVLATVPALAMLFAIGRGFGFQNLLKGELARYFPAQRQALDTAADFVDNYLQHASQGVFVGIGILFLLWTLISLMGNVEEAFNRVWGVTKNRSYASKVTDYTALLIILPVLLICSAGVSILMSNALQQFLPIGLQSPVVHTLLDCTPVVLVCIFFTAAFWLIPNTKVQFKYALGSGVLTGLACTAIEWLFMTGQLYVSNYNAIYGSFAFVLLLLVWLQLTWTVTLAGVVLTFSMQNVYNYSYNVDIEHISPNYAEEMTLIGMALIARRFERKEQPLTVAELSQHYKMPIIMAGKVINRLTEAKLITATKSAKKDGESGYLPAHDTRLMTVSAVRAALGKAGRGGFAKEFDGKFAQGFARISALRVRQQVGGDEPISALLDEAPAGVLAAGALATEEQKEK